MRRKTSVFVEKRSIFAEWVVDKLLYYIINTMDDITNIRNTPPILIFTYYSV